MRILYSATSYPPAIGGAQLHLHHLLLRLVGKQQVQVISFWDENRTDWLLGTTLRAFRNAKEYEIEGIPVHRLGLSLGEKLSILPFVLMYYPLQGIAIEVISSLLQEKIRPHAQGVDLIHNARIGREPLSYASYKLARRLGVPFFLTPYHHPRWRGWLYRHYIRLYRLADGIIALTEAEKQMLVGLGVREERITVTGMGPILADGSDAEAFREKHGIHGPIVLFLGQKYRYKNIEALLKATKFVWQRYPDVHFVFMGPRTPYSQMLFSPPSDTRILELDTVSLQEKTDALAACDLLCLPSTQESFGGVFLEAWMMEKPVIGAGIPAVREVITDEVDGLLVQPNPEAIGEKILFLLDHPRIAHDMGKHGKEKVSARYTWERIAQKTEEAYARVLKG